MRGIFLDDERNPEDVTWLTYTQDIEWTVVRTYGDFERAVICEQYDVISFDHDIQDFTDEGEERTGYTCFKRMLEFVLDGMYNLPICYVHSKNVAGAKNIKDHYENAKKFLQGER